MGREGLRPSLAPTHLSSVADATPITERPALGCRRIGRSAACIPGGEAFGVSLPEHPNEFLFGEGGITV